MGRLEVLDKCKENIYKANEIIGNEQINPIVKIMTKPLITRINQIEQICSVEKYNLCFIGKVGVGKSTAISSLLGIIDQSKMKNECVLTEIPLLKTAEGRTTLCETIIYYDEQSDSNITIEKLEYNKFKELIDEYCMSLLKKTKDNSEEKIECPSEVRRVIRNMSKLPQKLNEEKQLQYLKDTLGDEYDENDSNSTLLKKAILKNINYEKRNKDKFVFDKKKSIQNWLKDIFSQLNDGEIEDAPYPSKIIITINRNDFNVKIPNFINSVQDTRGIDGEGVREDIIKACNDISNICIICDSIHDYGNMASEGFLKNQFIRSNKDLKYRNLVMGLEQGGQLKRVNDADGRENGKDIKKEEALAKWKDICLDEDNMLFYNAFFGISYDSEEQIISKIDIHRYDDERNSVMKNIENKIDNMYEEYSKELADINHQLNIFQKNDIENSHKQKISDIREIIYDCSRELKNEYNLLIEHLDNQIRNNINASTIRGCVNREGLYDNYNIYVQGKDISFEEFDNTCKTPIYHIEKQLTKVFDTQDMMEDALQTAIKYQMNILFKTYRDKNANDYYDALFNNIYTDPSWSDMKSFWGNSIRGYKYRDRVTDVLLKVIKEKQVVKYIIEKKNTYCFFTELAEFINF